MPAKQPKTEKTEPPVPHAVVEAQAMDPLENRAMQEPLVPGLVPEPEPAKSEVERVKDAFVRVLYNPTTMANIPASMEAALRLYETLKAGQLAKPVHFLRVRLGVPLIFAETLYKELRAIYAPAPVMAPGGNVPPGTLTVYSGADNEPQEITLMRQQLAELRQVVARLTGGELPAEASTSTGAAPYAAGYDPALGHDPALVVDQPSPTEADKQPLLGTPDEAGRVANKRRAIETDERLPDVLK